MDAPADLSEPSVPHTLLDVVERVGGLGGDEQAVTIARMLEAIGRRAYGPLLLLIGLISISPLTAAPGATWAAAAVTFVLSAQMALGAAHPWLPQNLLDVRIASAALRRAAAAATPWARRIDAVLHPRLTWLVDPPLAFITALACATAALLTFPLGLIPLAPIAPGTAIALFGLALTTRDGVIAAFGWICLAAIGWAGAATVG
jgi:hypothetical protein